MLPDAKRQSLLNMLGKEKLGNASTWLDNVRDGKVAAPEFKRNFPANKFWHYVSYPIGSKGYKLDSRFSSKTDVVHAMEYAIQVLEGSPSNMTKLEALRVILHLSGDIHQPFHCTSGYYIFIKPDTARLTKTVRNSEASPNDHGGRRLFCPHENDLHSLWNASLPLMIARQPARLAKMITPQTTASVPITPGDYHNWAEIWATDSIRQANRIYGSIRPLHFQNDILARHDRDKFKILAQPNRGANEFITEQKRLLQQQLTKSAVHLAQLLTVIRM